MDAKTDTHRAWYYVTEDICHRHDPYAETDVGLAWLCDECAQAAGDKAQHASEDDLYESPCWQCRT